MRVIAKLDVKPPNVVKPVHFEGLRKMGQPASLAKKYYEQGADEIFYIDIVASLYQRELNILPISEASEPILVPFAVGGGVRSLDDFSRLFHQGADKVVINTAALHSPSLISEAAKIFGSQAVVVNIEAKRSQGHWLCYSDGGRIASKSNTVEWAIEAESLGAGELIIQSVDCDGRRRGYDIELISTIVDAVNIPVVAASGAGSLEHIGHVATIAKPSGIAVSSMLHYKQHTIAEIKAYLSSLDIGFIHE